MNENVVFKRLGLCVTDEQHRFGVSQRLQLTDTDSSPFEPHVLVMSATPIPRTLAMVLYGDLDLSTMKEMPKGRQNVKTYTAREKDRPRVERLIRRKSMRHIRSLLSVRRLMSARRTSFVPPRKRIGVFQSMFSRILLSG